MAHVWISFSVFRCTFSIFWAHVCVFALQLDMFGSFFSVYLRFWHTFTSLDAHLALPEINLPYFSEYFLLFLLLAQLLLLMEFWPLFLPSSYQLVLAIYNKIPYYRWREHIIQDLPYLSLKLTFILHCIHVLNCTFFASLTSLVAYSWGIPREFPGNGEVLAI